MKGVNSVVAIDPGNLKSGIAVISSGRIIIGSVENNDSVIEIIKSHLSLPSVTVVVEDVKPFSLRLSDQVISTCKFIGELNYRLKNELGANVAMMTRSSVKEWVFNRHPEICIPRINKKILLLHERRLRLGLKGLQSKDGEMRKPSFVFVDDRIVIAAMKEHWNIPTPKVGKKTQFGLSSHSWQALGLATVYANTILGEQAGAKSLFDAAETYNNAYASQNTFIPGFMKEKVEVVHYGNTMKISPKIDPK